MPCPYCGAALAEGARLCTTCGRLIAPRQPGEPSGAAPMPPVSVPPGPTPPPGPRPVYQPGASSSADPYSPFFDPASLTPETAAAWRQHRFHATYSVLLVLLVHFLTLGAASPFLVARKYTFLPRVRRDDFSTARAAGFLFIPIFALYWTFVLCRRIVDRLTLQARLWSLPGAPSRSFATAAAVSSVVSSVVSVVPYAGIPFLLVANGVLWPIYLAQLQRFCNRLALSAAPPDVRPSMLALERAMRLRWIGWVIIVPCLLIVVSGLVVTVVAPLGTAFESIVGIMIFLALASGGGVLLYLGERGARPIQDHLESRAPVILAGYLRIDKNAAWSVAWTALVLAAAFVLAGLITLYGPAPTTPREEGWPSVAIGATLGVGAAYAVWRALHLRRQLAWLSEQRPFSGDSEAPGW